MTATSDLLLAWDRKRPRSQQREMGMSEVGGCRKRAGYRMAGTEPTNASSSVQAILGTAIHDAIADVLAEQAAPGDLYEHEVRFAGILGHLDRYEAETEELVDVKTTSSRWLEHIKLTGPDLSHLWQVHLYGAALIGEKRPVSRVRIDYIARDTGEEWSWRQRFNPQIVRDALEWLKTVRDSPLDMLPRDYEPDSAWCRGCPFRDPCWGGAVRDRSPLSVLFVEDPDAERWANDLWVARAEEKDAKKRAKRAVGALDAIRPLVGQRVQAGRYTLDFRVNGLYFVSGDHPIPAVGFEEGDA